jgi:hypothetical protein
MRRRAALSEVISAVILAGVVLAVGGAVWSYSVGASTVIAEDYVNDTLSLLNEVTERFVVEHVSYDSGTNKLSVWVYNYGEQKIIVDTYANVTTATTSFQDSTSGTVVHKGESIEAVITLSQTVASEDRVSIKVYSRRQNFAYKTYFIP